VVDELGLEAAWDGALVALVSDGELEESVIDLTGPTEVAGAARR
jgi:hypothetical protein